ncbi:MAG: hypothetical protein Q8N17_01610 [Burkholderiaceae bacterium]|nr:hypothetical protein [Burkholderiaceae bacterium]
MDSSLLNALLALACFVLTFGGIRVVAHLRRRRQARMAQARRVHAPQPVASEVLNKSKRRRLERQAVKGR